MNSHLKSNTLKEGMFTGEVTNKRVVGGFVLTESNHVKDELISNHAHENSYISLVLGGSYKEGSITDSRIMGKGQALYRASDYEHHNQIGDVDCMCFNLELDESFLHKHDFARDNKMITFEKNNLELLSIFLAFRYGVQDDLCLVTLQENLFQLFSNEEIRNSINDNSWVKKLMEEVRLRPQEVYSVEGIAERLSLHPSYFVRKFKYKTGSTFSSFLIRERLRKAIELMASDRTLTEVAHQSGFYDQSHFIRHFKSTFHFSPKYFQKARG